MIDIIDKEIDQLKETYLLANTPGQIYRWFRESELLSELAAKGNEEELLEQYKVRTEKEEKTIDDVVIAYAILAVISFFEYREGKLMLEKLNLQKLQWGEDLKRLYFQGVRPTIYSTASGKGISLEDICVPDEIKTGYMTSSVEALVGSGSRDGSLSNVSYELVDVDSNKGDEEK